MTTLEAIADKVSKQIERKVMFMTLPQREQIRQMLVTEFHPVCTEQGNLHFSEADTEKNAEQAQRILQLLKDRRSRGATNVELAEIALKYTSRVSELRQAPHFYKIICTKEAGRITRYRLTPEDY